MCHVIGDSYSGQTATEKQTNKQQKTTTKSNNKKSPMSGGHKGASENTGLMEAPGSVSPWPRGSPAALRRPEGNRPCRGPDAHQPRGGPKENWPDSPPSRYPSNWSCMNNMCNCFTTYCISTLYYVGRVNVIVCDNPSPAEAPRNSGLAEVAKNAGLAEAPKNTGLAGPRRTPHLRRPRRTPASRIPQRTPASRRPRKEPASQRPKRNRSCGGPKRTGLTAPLQSIPLTGHA